MFQVILFKYGQQKIPKGLKNELLNLLGILIGAYSDNECVKKEINCPRSLILLRSLYVYLGSEWKIFG
jgi:hypothetical protein